MFCSWGSRANTFQNVHVRKHVLKLCVGYLQYFSYCILFNKSLISNTSPIVYCLLRIDYLLYFSYCILSSMYWLFPILLLLCIVYYVLVISNTFPIVYCLSKYSSVCGTVHTFIVLLIVLLIVVLVVSLTV